MHGSNFALLCLYSGAAISCLTVQNSYGVTMVQPLAGQLVKDQVQAVLDDHRVTHIKIGMIGTGEIAASVAALLQKFTGEVIYDPVMTATTGQSLTAAKSLSTIKDDLLPTITVLTPNLPELAVLTGLAVKETEQIRLAAESLLAAYPVMQCVVVKGGHARKRETNGSLTDYCFHRQGKPWQIHHQKISSQNTHGTGCTFASAFCAYHLKTDSYEQAFMKSIQFVWQLIKNSTTRSIVRNPHGHGPMLHGIQP